jgi:hypothetical protein
MAMKGRMIINFIELWSIAGFLPLSEKVLKFNRIFHDSNIFPFFLKHPNKAEFKNLDDSLDFSSDFPCLRTSAVSITLSSLSDLNDLNSLNSSKHLLNLMVGSSLAPK